MSAIQKTKTWQQVRTEIDETFRKWHGAMDLAIESKFEAAKTAEVRKAGKPGQTLEERTVTLTFRHLVREPGRLWATARLVVNREDTALGNLELLAKTVEWMRMADVRGITRPVVKLYRQIYPDPVKQQQQAPRQERPEQVKSSGASAVLHIADDAPLAVAEAAYRALIRDVHPDHGGSHDLAVALNAAIHTIRLRHTANVR